MKPIRCKIGFHNFEKKVRGKNNHCKSCSQEIYVKTWDEEFQDSERWDWRLGEATSVEICMN